MLQDTKLRLKLQAVILRHLHNLFQSGFGKSYRRVTGGEGLLKVSDSLLLRREQRLYVFVPFCLVLLQGFYRGLLILILLQYFLNIFP